MEFRDAHWPVNSVAMIRLEESDEARGVGRKPGDDPAQLSSMMILY
jgi:hypothetical protein